MRKPRIEDLLRQAPKLPVGSEHNIPPFAKFDDELLGQARLIGQNNLGGLTPLLDGAYGAFEVTSNPVAIDEQAYDDGESSFSDSDREERDIDINSLLSNRTLIRNAEQAWRESKPDGEPNDRREVGFHGRGSFDKYGRVTKMEIGRFIFGKRGLDNNHMQLGPSPFSVRRGQREFLIRFHTHPYPLSHSIGPSKGGDHAPDGGFTIIRNRRGYCVMNEYRQKFGRDGACTV